MELASRIGKGTGLSSIEVGRRLWIVVPPSTVDSEQAGELRDALVEALDRGALNLVVDLTTVVEMSSDAVDVLAAVSETLLARGGLLWLANMGGDGYSFAILPVDERGLGALVGLSPAIDAILLGDSALNGGDRAA